VAFGSGAGGNQQISARIPVSAESFSMRFGLTGGMASQVNGKVGHR
jgi:hypothetical protein